MLTDIKELSLPFDPELGNRCLTVLRSARKGYTANEVLLALVKDKSPVPEYGELLWTLRMLEHCGMLDVQLEKRSTGNQPEFRIARLD
jgi:hypothetical protein